MNNLFLMAERDLQSLRHEIAVQQQIGTPRAQMADSSYRSSQGSISVLKVHGVILSRRSWLSQLLGLRTTEEHLDNLSDMLASGGDVLLDIDSPGGDASLAFEFADMIASGGERVTAYSGGYATSAGMLFLTAANKSYAHRSATLGSIGVVGYFNSSDSENVVYSANARNKKPTRDVVQRDIDNTEKLFIEYVGRGTGLTSQQVISSGNSGDIFSGDTAVANGFINGTTTLQNLTAGKPDQQTQQMAAFVYQQLSGNPDIKADEMLANYLSIYPNTGTPAASKKQQSDDDWQQRLEFIKSGVSRRKQPAQQPPKQQASSGDDWESRLAFMRQYARSGCV